MKNSVHTLLSVRAFPSRLARTFRRRARPTLGTRRGQPSSPQSTSTQPIDAQLRSGNPRWSALVIDASGSMQANDWPPSRLDAAKEAAKAYCDRLAQDEPNAHVAVIAYGDDALAMCGLTQVTKRRALARAISRIDYLGYTNMRSGLQEAYQILYRRGGDRQVLLLSDGHNNDGNPCSVADALRCFSVIDTVGIGGSPAEVDEELMRYIATEYPDGTKRYRWIGDKESLVAHFQELAGRIRRA